MVNATTITAFSPGRVGRHLGRRHGDDAERAQRHLGRRPVHLQPRARGHRPQPEHRQRRPAARAVDHHRDRVHGRHRRHVRHRGPATNYTVSSSTSITVTSPAQAAGAVAVTVTVPGGTSATSPADLFTYDGAPAVTAVNPITACWPGAPPSPSPAPTSPGPRRSISATAARIFTVNSSTSITATSPAGAAGTVDVTVTTPAGTSATSAADQFTYYSIPLWSLASPASTPSSRQAAAEAYDPATGQTILFGGGNSAGTADFADTWAWNGSTWTELAATGAPPAEQASAMAYDPATGQLVLFGG